MGKTLENKEYLQEILKMLVLYHENIKGNKDILSKFSAILHFVGIKSPEIDNYFQKTV